MPQRQRRGTRSTVDLHANWWSDARDEATGRYRERVVIYTSLLHREQRAQQERLLSSGLLAKIDPKALAALNAEALGRGDASGLSALAADSGLDLAALARDGEGDVMAWVAEITGPDGAVELARDGDGGFVDGAGAPVADPAAALDEFEERDVAFVVEAIRARMQAPVVPVTAQDAADAARGHPAAEGLDAAALADGRGAAAVAEDRFRQGGGGALS